MYFANQEMMRSNIVSPPVFPINRNFPPKEIDGEDSLIHPLPLMSVDVFGECGDCWDEEKVIEETQITKGLSHKADCQSFFRHKA